MSKAFLSEHSAEYILVSRLVAIMARHFSKVIPIYFLSNREGSTISRKSNSSQAVRVLSMFARRPKIETPGQPNIEVKFNESLFDISQLSAPLGIPTFAGVPLVSSIMDFGFDSNCALFELSGSSGDVHYTISLDGTVLSFPHQSSVIEGPLEEDDLVKRVLRKSRYLNWDEAIENLRTIRRGAHPYEESLYGRRDSLYGRTHK